MSRTAREGQESSVASLPTPRRRGRRAPLAIIAAVSVASVTAACGSTTGGTGSTNSAATASGSPQKGGTLTVAVSAPVPTLDPAAGSANGMALVGNAIYDSLMTIPKLGDPAQPNIAKSMVSSAGGLVWTMTVPTGISFSDGTPFNAAAIVYNMQRDMAPTSSAAALLTSVASVSASNPTTVVFHLKTPYSTFPDVFAYDGSGTVGYIASPTALKKWGKNYTSHAAGVGPFELQSWTPDGNISLVRNPHYWNKTQPVYLNGVQIRDISSDQSAFEAVQANNLNIMGTADPSVLSNAQHSNSVQTVMGDSNDNQDSIVLNLAEPPFNTLSMRRAVSMALNRQQIASLTTNGLGRPAVNLFPAGNPFHDSAADPGFDLAGAKALVKAYTQQTGKAPTFTYTCNNQRPATDVIVQQLTQAGFAVKVNEEETTSWVNDFFAKKYQAICWTMAPFATPAELPYRFFYSSGDLNTGGFKSTAFDNAANAGRSAATVAEQKTEWDKADQILTQQLPWVWTTSGPIGFVLSKNVHGTDYEQPQRLRYYVPSVGLEWLSK